MYSEMEFDSVKFTRLRVCSARFREPCHRQTAAVAAAEIELHRCVVVHEKTISSPAACSIAAATVSGIEKYLGNTVQCSLAIRIRRRTIQFPVFIVPAASVNVLWLPASDTAIHL